MLCTETRGVLKVFRKMRDFEPLAPLPVSVARFSGKSAFPTHTVENLIKDSNVYAENVRHAILSSHLANKLTLPPTNALGTPQDRDRN